VLHSEVFKVLITFLMHKLSSLFALLELLQVIFSYIADELSVSPSKATNITHLFNVNLIHSKISVHLCVCPLFMSKLFDKELQNVAG